ncbi:MAG: right-handed parallel beta-helix repeat-containing protein, partial [Methylocella sp.]
VLSSAGSLTISDCFVRHFQNAGIFLNPIGALNFLVSNTISADNGNGIIISSTSAAKGVVDRFTASNNNNGIFIEAPGNVSILNSVLMNNNIVGVAAVTSGLTVIARKSVANNNGGGNGVGFNVANGATLTLADSMATGNPQAGIYISGGTVYSYGDNEINGNGTDVTGGTLTSVAKR